MPAPCSRRAIISMAKFMETDANARPATQSTMAMMNVVLFVNLRLQYDEIGMTMATMSR